MAIVEETTDALLKSYLSNRKILIIDSVSSARVSLATVLTSFGAQRSLMTLVGSIEEAKQELAKNGQRVIFSDYQVGDRTSLDLIQVQKSLFEKEKIKDNLFVLVTANASQSTVARAAEEDVDTFVIKPYSTNILKKALAQSIQLKLYPSLYLQLIDQGKDQLFTAQYDKAIELFEKASLENAKPTLALFYYGQAEYLKKALQVAEDKYSKGLEFNNIHYKCLVGLFELLHQEKKYADAYEVIKKLSQYFPANPKRLSSVLRLAIMTDNFHDMEGYYRIFIKIDERTDELVRYMCSALLVTGKYYLRQKIRARALEVFENAAISAAGRVGFLLYIIEALVDRGMHKECQPFLDRMRLAASNSHEYQAAQFLVMTLKDDVKLVVQKGRALVESGVSLPCVYEKLIAQSVRGGFLEVAHEFSKAACAKWPDKIKLFTYAFEGKEFKGNPSGSLQRA